MEWLLLNKIEEIQQEQNAIIAVKNPNSNTANNIVKYAENVFVAAFVTNNKFTFYDIQEQTFSEKLTKAYKQRLKQIFGNKTPTLKLENRIYILKLIKF